MGIAWTAVTCAVMLALASGKAATGKGLGNPVLKAEGKVTLVDAYLAGAVLVGLLLRAALGWWWADPISSVVIVFYGLRRGWRPSPRSGLSGLRPTVPRIGSCLGHARSH